MKKIKFISIVTFIFIILPFEVFAASYINNHYYVTSQDAHRVNFASSNDAEKITSKQFNENGTFVTTSNQTKGEPWYYRCNGYIEISWSIGSTVIHTERVNVTEIVNPASGCYPTPTDPEPEPNPPKDDNTEIKQNQKTIINRIEITNSTLITLINEITNVKTILNTRLTSIDNHLQGVNDKLDRQYNRLGEMNNKLTSIDNHLNNISNFLGEQFTSSMQPKDYDRPNITNKLDENKPNLNLEEFTDNNTYFKDNGSAPEIPSMPMAPDIKPWTDEQGLEMNTEEEIIIENELNMDNELQQDSFNQDSELVKDNFNQSQELEKDSFNRDSELVKDNFNQSQELEKDSFNRDSELVKDKFNQTEIFNRDLPMNETEENYNLRWKSVNGVFQ